MGNYGMSDVGTWSLMDQGNQGDMIMRLMARNSMSENLQQKIDDAVKKLAREAMDSIVEVLLQKETISGHEFREMLAKYVTIPAGNMPAPSEEGSYVPTL